MEKQWVLSPYAQKKVIPLDRTSKKAFNNFKAATARPPVLALPEFSKPFIIVCDASINEIRAVIVQEGLAFLARANREVSSYDNV